MAHDSTAVLQKNQQVQKISLGTPIEIECETGKHRDLFMGCPI